MDEAPPTVVFPPPSEPRRPAWEVALLFSGILLFLVLWGTAQWMMNTRGKYAGIRGLGETRMAERLAGAALIAAGPQQPALWRRVIREYRDALAENPGLRRARRGLAAALYMNGDKTGAKAAMRGPAEFKDADPAGVRAWEATQIAFGARPRPLRAAALHDERAALDDPRLGWARYPALMALAPDAAAAETYRARMVKEYAATSMMWVGGAIFLALLLLLPLGIFLLDRGLRLPRDLMPPLPVPTAALIVGFVTALFIYQGGSVLVAGAYRGLTGALGTGTAGRSPTLAMAAMAAGALLGLGAALAYVAGLFRRAGAGIADLGWRARDAVKWAVGGYIALVPPLAGAFVVMALLARFFPHVRTPQNPAVDMVVAARGPGLVLVFLLVCVIAPVAEEFLFRGLLFRGLEKRYGLLVGALAAGTLFAGMHPQLPFGFPPIFVLGVGLCYLYRISGSLVPGMLLHGANNGIALALALLTAGR